MSTMSSAATDVLVVSVISLGLSLAIFPLSGGSFSLPLMMISSASSSAALPNARMAKPSSPRRNMGVVLWCEISSRRGVRVCEPRGLTRGVRRLTPRRANVLSPVLLEFLVDSLELRVVVHQRRDPRGDDRQVAAAERILEFDDPPSEEIHLFGPLGRVLLVGCRAERPGGPVEELLEINLLQARLIVEQLAELRADQVPAVARLGKLQIDDALGCRPDHLVLVLDRRIVQTVLVERARAVKVGVEVGLLELGVLADLLLEALHELVPFDGRRPELAVVFEDEVLLEVAVRHLEQRIGVIEPAEDQIGR